MSQSSEVAELLPAFCLNSVELLLLVELVDVLLTALIAAEVQRLIAIADGDGITFINIRSAHGVLHHFSRFHTFFLLLGLLFGLLLAVVHKQPIQNVADQCEDDYLNDHTLS